MLVDLTFKVNGFSCEGKVANYAQQCQQHSQWCWAAVAASIAKYYNPGRAVSQCSVASAVLHRQCCQGPPLCVYQKPPASNCDIAHYLGDALAATQNVSSQTDGGPLPFPAIQTSIDGGDLIACGIAAGGGAASGGAHAVVIYGYLTATDGTTPQEIVLVKDPLSPVPLPEFYSVFANKQALQSAWTDSWVAGPAPNDPLLSSAPDPKQISSLSIIVGNLLEQPVPQALYDLRVVSLQDAADGQVFTTPIAAQRFFFESGPAGLACDLPLAVGHAERTAAASIEFRDDPRTAAPAVTNPVYLEIPALHIRGLELSGGRVQLLAPPSPALYDLPAIISQDEFTKAIQPTARQVLAQVQALNERRTELRQ